ncbi:MAG: LLM class flavin-dependent oxidoreductase [Candidatus Dormiibacterota bacterium]
MPELGLLLLPDRPVRDLVVEARHAEALGFGTVWVADEKFYRDPWVVLSATALATSRIRLGTGVTEPYARHPALIAAAMATLEELAPGRIVVGLGAGGPGFPPMAVHRRRPAVALPEAVEILRGLFRGERVYQEGRVLSFLGGALNFPPARPLPIYVAARGERVMEAAASCADAVIVAPFASPEAVTLAAGVVRGAAERSGVPPPKIVARVDVSIAESAQAAREAVRHFVALPLWVSYPNLSYAERLGVELPQELVRCLARREYDEIDAAAAMLPGAMFDHFAIAGRRSDVKRRLASLLPIVDEVIVHPVPAGGASREELATQIAEVWSEVRADRETEKRGSV